MSISEYFNPVLWGLAAVAVIALLAGSSRDRRAARALGALLLTVVAAGLVAAMALPQLLPIQSAIVHPDGTTGDPRVLTTLLLGVAAFVALVPAFSALKLPPLGLVGIALPGVLAGALMAGVAYAGRLHQPPALVGIGLAGLVAGIAIALAFRSGARAQAGGLLAQAFGLALLVLAAVVTLHGARTGGMAMQTGSAADTLGGHVAFLGVDSPSRDVHVFRVLVQDGRDSALYRPTLRGAAGAAVLAIPDARPFGGPVVVPIALDERRDKPHDVQWLKAKETLHAGDATITFAGWRIEQKDSIRMYADLEVSTASGTQKVAPGLVATPKGEFPFAAMAPGYGPIAIAGVDADNHRVGLILPRLSTTGLTQVGVVELRLRPLLGMAWGALALVLLGLFAAFVPPPATPSR